MQMFMDAISDVNSGGYCRGYCPPPRICFRKKVDFKIQYLKNLQVNNLNVQMLQIFQILSQHILNDSKF